MCTFTHARRVVMKPWFGGRLRRWARGDIVQTRDAILHTDLEGLRRSTKDASRYRGIGQDLFRLRDIEQRPIGILEVGERLRYASTWHCSASATVIPIAPCLLLVQNQHAGRCISICARSRALSIAERDAPEVLMISCEFRYRHTRTTCS